MDEMYIKMCREAKEIQEGWEPKDGDCYYLKHDLYEPDWGGSLKLKSDLKYPNELRDENDWGLNIKYDECFEKGIYYVGGEMGVSNGYCDWETYDPDKVKENSIWLPRQEDLQKIVLIKKWHDVDRLLDEFISGWNMPTGQFNDLTTLWLCFVMETCYHKKWNMETQTWETTQ